MSVPEGCRIKTDSETLPFFDGTEFTPSGLYAITASGLKSGAHEVVFKVFDSSGILVYYTTQTINIFDNMTTNSWRDDGSGAFVNRDDMPGGGGLAFSVTEALVKQFVCNTIYVGGTGVGLDPNDDNAGTAYSPLNKLDAAFKRIAARGNGKDYRIYICGTVQGCSTLDTDITTGKAKSITIEGYGSGDKLKGYAEKIGNIQDFNGVNLSEIFTTDEFKPVLTVKTPVPVTIQNLAICEGASGIGGSGINIDGSACSVTIKDGVTISGNKTGKNGGGVQVRQGKFYMKGGVIEKNVAFNSFAGSCNGGGVCLRAGAYFEMTGGEIRENRACVGGGVGLVNLDGDSGSNKFLLKSGKISQNTADGYTSGVKCGFGGGIMIMSGSETVHHQVTMTGGEISGNKVNYSSSAVDVSSSAIFEMTGGVIKENSLKEGESDEHYHAIEVSYAANYFCLGGSAYIPAGSGKNHCVYLNGFKKDDDTPLKMSKINLGSNLSRHSQSDPLVIQFNESGAHAALRGSLAASASFDLTNAKEYIVPASDDWNLKLSSDKKTLVLDAPIWVAGTGAKQGAGMPSAAGPGTKSHPFDTIDNACAAMTDPNVDYTILIDGTLSGNQTISAASAKSITICGASPLPTTGADAGIPQDKIDAGGKMEDESWDIVEICALDINAAVSVTINNLMITGGRNGQGGGIRLSESGADLTLSSGAYVTKNKAKRSGGGVFVGRSCSLTIEDGAVIKENKAINTTIDTARCNGGGVYVYENSTLTMTGGTICENSAATGGAGGGVYCGENVDFSMSGGKICSNSALQGENGAPGTSKGGGVYCYKSNFTMRGGVIGDDSTSAAATSTTDCSNYVDYTPSSAHQQGGGIYYESDDNSKEMKLLGGTIARNYSSNHGGGVCVKEGKVTVKNTISYNCANEGGGVYNAGAFAMSGGKIYGNSAGKGNGIMVSKFNGQEARLEIQGCAYLPPDNVICLGDGTSVKITGALTPTDTGASSGAATCSTATITPTDYDSPILTAADGINLEDWIGYFVITPRDGDAPLSDGLAYGVGVDGKFDTSRILVTKSSDEVRDALYELTSHANEPVNICFATDFKPTTVLSETLDPESSGASGVQYRGLLKFYEGVTVNLSATKPVVIGESYSDYGSVIVTKKTDLTIGPNIKLVGNRKAEVLYQRGGNVTLNGCEITGSYGSTYAGLFVFATKDYGQALATINEGTKIYGNSGSGIRLQKMSDTSDCPDAILIMNGGEIYANGGNSEYHAGVTVYYGKVTKTGGRIYGNFGYTDQGPNKPSQVYFYKNGYWRNDSSNSYVMYGDGTRWTSDNETP